MPRDGFDLAVFEGGSPDRPTLLMVHGWPDTHRMWTGVAEALADDFHLVAYDTRGQGESPTGAPDAAFTVDELASDLFAVIDAVSPTEPVHVLGHDWGSVQAWEAVCTPGAQERIASFTSMSGPHLDHVSSWAMRSLLSPRGLVSVAGQAVSSSYVPFLVSPLAPPVLRVLGNRDMVSGLRYYRANLLHRRGRPRRRTTRVPVLQLELTHDPAVRRAALEASDPWVETLERRPLPYGHWAAVTRPGVVADEVRGFVSRCEGRTPLSR